MASAEWLAVYGEQNIPDTGRSILRNYVEHGLPPGSCYEAILAGDLFDAFKRADLETARALPAIVAWIYNQCPTIACGDRERVKAWIAQHAAARQKRAEGT